MRLTKGLHRVAAGRRKARYYKVAIVYKYPLECLPFSVVSPLLRNHLSVDDSIQVSRLRDGF